MGSQVVVSGSALFWGALLMGILVGAVLSAVAIVLFVELGRRRAQRMQMEQQRQVVEARARAVAEQRAVPAPKPRVELTPAPTIAPPPPTSVPGGGAPITP